MAGTERRSSTSSTLASSVVSRCILLDGRRDGMNGSRTMTLIIYATRTGRSYGRRHRTRPRKDASRMTTMT